MSDGRSVRAMRARRQTAGVLALLMLLTVAPVSAQEEPPAALAVVDVPAWQVGDTWTYDVMLDARQMVADAPDLDGATLDLMFGTGQMVVDQIALHDDDGELVPAYRMLTTASASGDGTFPDPYLGVLASGQLLGSISETTWLRMSDLAMISRTQAIVLDFEFVGFTINVADYTLDQKFTPAIEIYDFPLAANDSFSMQYMRAQDTSGNTGPVPSPGETQYTNYTMLHQVNQTGEGVDVAGCADALNVTWGQQDSPRFETHLWCDAVGHFAYRWSDDLVMDGVDGELTLSAFLPAGGSGAGVEVSLANRSSPLNQEVSLNVSGTAGTLEVWYHGESELIEWDGTSPIEIDVGNRLDDSSSMDEWGSHGIIVCTDALYEDPGSIEPVCDVVTVVLEGSALGTQLRGEVIDAMMPGGEGIQRLGQGWMLSMRF